MDAEDAYYDSAESLVAYYQEATSSMLQKELKVGYARAARLMDMLEENGAIGPPNGSKPREVLVVKIKHKPEVSLPDWFVRGGFVSSGIEESALAAKDSLVVLGYFAVNNSTIDPTDVKKLSPSEYVRYFNSGLNQLGARPSAIQGVDSFDKQDALFIRAVKLVIETEKASTGLLQRRLQIGYAQAAYLMDLLESNGVVGPADGASPRDVLIADIKEVEGFENGHG